MRIHESHQIVVAYTCGLRAADAGAIVHGLELITSFLADFGGVAMASLIERGSNVDCRQGLVVGSGPVEPNSSNIADHLDCAANIVASGGGNAGRIKDLRSLAKLLRRWSESVALSIVIDNLRCAMQPEPVERQIASFIERLKNDSGTASFERTLSELAASPLKREHVISIAKSVYGGIKSGASRRSALDLIRRPHDAYVSSKRGIDATGGRSAA